MFKTILDTYKVMLKKLLLATCLLLFLLEASLTSNIRNTEVFRISKDFKMPVVKISRRKQLSRPIPYYHNSTPARRMILSGDIELNPRPENPRKYPKGKTQRKQNQAKRAMNCTN